VAGQRRDDGDDEDVEDEVDEGRSAEAVLQ